MIAEPSPEQRRQDGRLAWMLVGLCAAITLAVLVGLFFALRGFVAEEAARSWERQAAETRAREEASRDAPWRRVDGEVPTDVAAAPPPGDSTRPVGNPASWIGPDDYPAYAMRNGDEGRVRVTVSVGKTGTPLGCAITESSGHWSLDNATCAAMLNHGRFEPRPRVRDRAYWTSPPIRWELPK